MLVVVEVVRVRGNRSTAFGLGPRRYKCAGGRGRRRGAVVSFFSSLNSLFFSFDKK